MKAKCLGSSSEGNCFYIEMERLDSAPVKLLIEAGLPYREIVEKAAMSGADIAGADTVLVTHQHGDHARAVKDFTKRGYMVYGNRHVASSPSCVLLPDTGRYVASDTKVYPFRVEHDAEDSLGFVISTDKEKILFVNDCKYFEKDLSGIPFDYIFIEANYDPQVIHFALENAREESDVQNIRRYERLIDSHMSLSNTIRTLKKMDLSRCRAIFLMHLSERHANRCVFKAKVHGATGINTFVCLKNGGLL